jgi:DnaJ-class molecular chaperone
VSKLGGILEKRRFMEFKDYYKILGVSKAATEQEIKTAYRKLARQYHPDLNPGDKKAEDKFKTINEAHDVLGDPEKRKKYDELGANWEQITKDQEYARQYTRPGFEWRTAEDFNLNDFFESFFGERAGPFSGGSHTGAARGPISGHDVESTIELSLEELAHGGKRQLRLSSPQPCPQCHGEGYVAVSSSKAGQRRAATTMQLCPTCRGQGEVTETRSIEVTIPKGLTDGSRLRLAGQGGKGRAGGRNGDLYLHIKTRPHQIFRLENYDLHAELPLLDYEAALGTKVPVPTLKGSVDLTIPPETQSGQLLRLKGKGLPKRAGEEAGDLYFHTILHVPTKLTQRERDLYAELQKLRSAHGNGETLRKRIH